MIEYKGKAYRNPWHAAGMTRTPPHKIYAEWKKAKAGEPSTVRITDAVLSDGEEPTLANIALEGLRRQIKFHTDAGVTPEHAYTANVLRRILQDATNQLEAIKRTDR